jgi:uncharacterized protein YbjT (DUF2867 family)
MENETGKSKAAVVFGSTGLVGKELVNELLNRDDYLKVIIVARRDLSVSNPKLEMFHLEDYAKLMDLKEKLKADAYFCCIGTTIKIAGTQEKFRQVDFEIPGQIARLAELLSVPYLVVISSIGASDRSQNFYLRTKGEMEKSVRELYHGNLKIVRPSLLMGNRDEVRLGEKVAVVFMKLFGWLFVGPLIKYRGIKAHDVARAMINTTHSPLEKTVFESVELHDILK